jgi:hypothetical protein
MPTLATRLKRRSAMRREERLLKAVRDEARRLKVIRYFQEIERATGKKYTEEEWNVIKSGTLFSPYEVEPAPKRYREDSE